MQKGKLHQQPLARFEFYLRTEAKLASLALRRDLGIVKRLLLLGVLASRQKFMAYCLERIESGINPSTVNRDISAIKKYLRFKKIKWKEIKKFKTVHRNMPAPTFEEVDTFRRLHTTPTLDMYWQMQTLCGTRPSEVLTLRARDIDFANSCFYPEHTKTNDGKPIILLPPVKSQLGKYIKTLPNPLGYLFPSPARAGKPLTLAAVEKDCRLRLQMMGCNKHYTPHSFRHAYITIGVAHGVPVQYLQRTARHADLSMTMSYVDTSVDYAKTAAYAHPFYREQMTMEEIVDDWVAYIKKSADVRFDRQKLHEVCHLMYSYFVTI